MLLLATATAVTQKFACMPCAQAFVEGGRACVRMRALTQGARANTLVLVLEVRQMAWVVDQTICVGWQGLCTGRATPLADSGGSPPALRC